LAEDEAIVLRDSVVLDDRWYHDDGPLILTDKRLSFRARDRRLTGGKRRIDIPLDRLASVSVQRKKRLFGAFKEDVLTVTTVDGANHTFSTHFAATWESTLKGLIAT
jgi:hypothetical protein